MHVGHVGFNLKGSKFPVLRYQIKNKYLKKYVVYSTFHCNKEEELQAGGLESHRESFLGFDKLETETLLA